MLLLNVALLLINLVQADSSVSKFSYKLAPVVCQRDPKIIYTKNQVACMQECNAFDDCCGFRFHLQPRNNQQNCHILLGCGCYEVQHFFDGMPSYRKVIEGATSEEASSHSKQRYTDASFVNTDNTISTRLDFLTTIEGPNWNNSTTDLSISTHEITATEFITSSTSKTTNENDPFAREGCKNEFGPTNSTRFKNLNFDYTRINNYNGVAKKYLKLYNFAFTTLYEEIDGEYLIMQPDIQRQVIFTHNCSLFYICKADSKFLFVNEIKDSGEWGIFLTWNPEYSKWKWKMENDFRCKEGESCTGNLKLNFECKDKTNSGRNGEIFGDN